MLIDKDSENLKEIIAKNVCEGAELVGNEGSENLEEAKLEIKVGGCGRYQPSFRRVGFDIFAEWKKRADENTWVRQYSLLFTTINLLIV